MKKIKDKVVRWIQTDERNFNIFYYGMFWLGVAAAALIPTAPFMNHFVQFGAILLIVLIVNISFSRKYYKKDWSNDD